MSPLSVIKKVGLTGAALGIGVLASIGAVTVGAQFTDDAQEDTVLSGSLAEADASTPTGNSTTHTATPSEASEPSEPSGIPDGSEVSESIIATPVAARSDLAFSETFDGNTGLENFDRGLWHRDDTVVAVTSWTGDHDENCGTPDTQRLIQRDQPEDSFYVCRDHMMTSVGNTSGYSIAWFSPRQVFNGQTEVSVDVNSTNLGHRQWFEFSLVPADYDSGVDGCELCISGASAVSSFFPSQPDNTLVYGLDIGGQRLMVNNEKVPRGGLNKLCNGTNPLDPEGCNSKPIRRTWRAVDNGNGTVTVSLPELGHEVTMDGSFPEGDWRFVIKDHNYTPTKDEMPVGFTWHWDNVIVK